MTYADSRKGEIVNGFKCIGHTRDRLWGQFKLDNSQEWSEQRRLEWQQENQRRRNEQASKNEELAKGALSIEERDRAIRRLHSHFGLSARHREDLQRRGLSNSQIDHLLYFTITPNQEIPFGIPANFPGVRDGQIKAAAPGYACVTFDPSGKASGWQIRLDDATGNKYRWAKGERSSHLSNGELPITSAYPVGETSIQPSGLVRESVKSAIAANRLGIVALGAASANFTASPQQSEEHLQKSC
jgi:hypothetical protein